MRISPYRISALSPFESKISLHTDSKIEPFSHEQSFIMHDCTNSFSFSMIACLGRKITFDNISSLSLIKIYRI